MFYSVASPDWIPGQALLPAGALLFRTRSEAESFAPDAHAVTVAVRFDGQDRLVRPHGAVAQAKAREWSAQAVANSLGGVTVFGSIPATLVRSAAEGETVANWRPRAEEDNPITWAAGFGGWDSLTVALLA